jgi:hypothetical protein
MSYIRWAPTIFGSRSGGWLLVNVVTGVMLRPMRAASGTIAPLLAGATR